MNITRLLLIFSYFFFVLFPALLIFILQPQTDNGIIHELGKLLALSGLMMILLQFILSARSKWLDRKFSYNNMVRFHRMMGIWAFVFIFLHPILLTLSEQQWDMLLSFNNSWYITLGKVTLLLLLIHILISIYRKKFHIKYERWRNYHDVLAVSLLILVFIHSFFAGSDLEVLPLQIIWVTLPLIGIAVFIWQRFYLYKDATTFKIEDVIKETEKVHTIKLVPENESDYFEFNPGQFHFIKFSGCQNLPAEEHPFTISSSPTQKSHLTSTIKASGDFTRQMGKLHKGEKVKVIGPYGKFSFLETPSDAPIVFIAGGIGVTPIMSMLRYMHDHNHEQDILLLYSNKMEPDIVFRDELDEIAAKSSLNLRVVHILSKQDNWQGEQGHIDKDLFKRYCKEPLRNNNYFLCGPPSMSQSVLKELKKLHVPLKNIHCEAFALAESSSPATFQKKQAIRISLWIITAFISLNILLAGTRSDWSRYDKTPEQVHHHDEYQGGSDEHH